MARVLVVDDSAEFRGVICAWIAARPGLELAATAANGRDAVDAVEPSRPDLVLMDAVMPQMDGFEATRRIKARPGAPLVAILTLHDSETIRRAAAEAGADGFVSKGELHLELPRLLEDLLGDDLRELEE